MLSFSEYKNRQQLIGFVVKYGLDLNFLGEAVRQKRTLDLSEEIMNEFLGKALSAVSGAVSGAVQGARQGAADNMNFRLLSKSKQQADQDLKKLATNLQNMGATPEAVQTFIAKFNKGIEDFYNKKMQANPIGKKQAQAAAQQAQAAANKAPIPDASKLTGQNAAPFAMNPAGAPAVATPVQTTPATAKFPPAGPSGNITI